MENDIMDNEGDQTADQMIDGMAHYLKAEKFPVSALRNLLKITYTLNDSEASEKDVAGFATYMAIRYGRISNAEG